MAELTAILKRSRVTGTKMHRQALAPDNNNIAIDFSGTTKNNVNTSVDCYVSGSYTSKDGKTIDVKQRYTIFVSYNRDTQKQAMDEVRKRIIADFTTNFSEFSITDVFIPESKFITPLGDSGKTEEAEFYYGSEMFKQLSRIDVGRYKITTERAIHTQRVGKIKDRYRL